MLPAFPVSIRAMPMPVLSIPTVLGECPVWDAANGEVIITDAAADRLHHVDPVSGSARCRHVPAPVVALAPMRSGDLLVACTDGLWRLSRNAPRMPLPTPVLAGIRFNDGACDPQGRFWIGSRGADFAAAAGVLFRVDPDGRWQAMDRGFGVCNGLGWSPDARVFYLIDTVPRLLYRYDFDPVTGTLGKRTVLSRFDGIAGKPDGMAVDMAGRLWVALWDGGGIVVLSADGDPLGFVPTPALRPTSCAFAGDDLRTLVVTTATTGLDPADPAFGRSGELLTYAVDCPGLANGVFG